MPIITWRTFDFVPLVLLEWFKAAPCCRLKLQTRKHLVGSISAFTSRLHFWSKGKHKCHFALLCWAPLSCLRVFQIGLYFFCRKCFLQLLKEILVSSECYVLLTLFSRTHYLCVKVISVSITSGKMTSPGMCWKLAELFVVGLPLHFQKHCNQALL